MTKCGRHCHCSQNPPAELTAMPYWRNLTLLQEGEGGDHILAAIGTAASTIQRHEYLQRRPELQHNGGKANGNDKGSAAGEAQQDLWSPCFPAPAWFCRVPWALFLNVTSYASCTVHSHASSCSACLSGASSDSLAANPAADG